MVKVKRYCGHCHTCGTKLREVLDGEEWCPVCQTYRRYRSHGWHGRDTEGGAYCTTDITKEE